MDRVTRLNDDDREAAQEGPQVRLRLGVIDRRAGPVAAEQAIRITRTCGAVSSGTVIRYEGQLTVETLLLARQVLARAACHVEHELEVRGYTDEVDRVEAT